MIKVSKLLYKYKTSRIRYQEVLSIIALGSLQCFLKRSSPTELAAWIVYPISRGSGYVIRFYPFTGRVFLKSSPGIGTAKALLLFLTDLVVDARLLLLRTTYEDKAITARIPTTPTIIGAIPLEVSSAVGSNVLLFPRITNATTGRNRNQLTKNKVMRERLRLKLVRWIHRSAGCTRVQVERPRHRCG